MARIIRLSYCYIRGIIKCEATDYLFKFPGNSILSYTHVSHVCVKYIKQYYVKKNKN